MLLLTMLSLCVGCTTIHSDTLDKVDKLTVPAVRQYTPEKQRKAAGEMVSYCDVVPTLCEFVNDYGRMRDQARVALGEVVDTTR
jgi:hypothetical protein